MILRNASVFCPDGSFARKELYVDDATGRFCADSVDGPVVDAANLIAIPGLVDLHFHGCMGHDLCEGTAEALQAVADYEASVGVLAICPATMTCPVPQLQKIVAAAAAHKNGTGADLVGLHLEGPFLSPEKAGAQDPQHTRLPDAELFRSLQRQAGGLIRICDIAPELPGAEVFIRDLAGEVKLSLAHTYTDYETAARAFAAGADHMTHLFNAMPGVHHRSPGPIPAAVEAGAEAELICDGVHLHAAMVRLAFRLFGAERVIIVSDSTMATGLTDGEYELGGQAVTVRGRRVWLTSAPDTIAGSCTNLFDCMRRAVLEMDIALGSAVRAAALNPARSLGIDADYGSLQPGRYASFILLDEKLSPVQIWQKGRRLR